MTNGVFFRTAGDAKRDWARRYPKKIAASLAVRAAIVAGRLVRLPCEACGATRRIHAHHADYDRPLDVMWLCGEHHLEWHRANGAGLNGGEELSSRLAVREELRHGLATNCDLWSVAATEGLERKIRAEIATEFGFEPRFRVDPRGLRCSADDFGSCGADPVLSPYGEEFTLQEIGDTEGVTRERIRQLEERALVKMRPFAEELFSIGGPLPVPCVAPAIENPRVVKLTRAVKKKIVRIARRRVTCGVCGGRGHNKLTCPSRKAAA